MATKQIVTTDQAPAWDGFPYSQAVRFGDMVFVSGQLGIDEESGQPAEGAAAQTDLILESVKAILGAAGTSIDNVVTTTCYLTNRERDYDAFNTVYSKYFPAPEPARATIQVAQLAPGYHVEIVVVACVPS